MKKITVIGLGDSVIEDLNSDELALKQAEEKAWNDNALDRSLQNLRDKRNRLLAETDYLALSDNTLSDDMKKYRQDLRDITEGLTKVEEVEAVEFPTKP
tara:strand:- start:158 stop:454 length:297 start_codon:yes stop_codon:yes gene_type:complete